ncbi:T9SS type A sorting domain-containing protein [Weeksellaceae bacterium KMM 9724]|uniref:T9SS type A sorting domain-containing protein n=1 Tax=Profundicola chukchiensis TaxID=2961959 RepID=UPI00243E4E9E|nr:T9SS type A sorting domain-containing protein [Profundicola chukchiensis]MDG4949894.1 T9SS type A sorting domain-containing protein [Profundicola chukchiensis]
MKNYLFFLLAFFFANTAMQAETLTCTAPDASSITLTRTAPKVAVISGADANLTYQIKANQHGNGFDRARTINNISMPHTQGGLNSSIAYDIWMRTDCGDGTFSEWVGPLYLPKYGEVVEPVCTAPNAADIVLTRTSATSASFDGADANFTYEVKANKHGNGMELAQTITNVSMPHSQSGLNAAIAYDIWIRKDCGDGTFSEWVGPLYLPKFGEVIDPVVCTAPNASDIVLTRTGVKSATIDGASSDFTYEVKANKQGNGMELAQTLTNVTMPYTFNRLSTHNIAYDIWIRTNCGNGEFSEWTGPLSLPMYASNAKISPNPTNGLVKIQNVDAVNVQVFGMTGNLELSSKVMNNEVNLSNLKNGQYIMQVTDANGKVTTTKLMKK